MSEIKELMTHIFWIDENGIESRSDIYETPSKAGFNYKLKAILDAIEYQTKDDVLKNVCELFESQKKPVVCTPDNFRQLAEILNPSNRLGAGKKKTDPGKDAQLAYVYAFLVAKLKKKRVQNPHTIASGDLLDRHISEKRLKKIKKENRSLIKKYIDYFLNLKGPNRLK